MENSTLKVFGSVDVKTIPECVTNATSKLQWPLGDIIVICLQSCAKELEWSLFQDSEETIHSADKNDTSYKRTGFFTEVKQEKIQNGRLRKFNMAT